MSLFKKLLLFFIPVLVASLVLFVPVKAAAAPAGATVIYNIYATDGFVSTANGTPVYIYGFVGGREGQPYTFLNSAQKTIAKEVKTGEDKTTTVYTVAGKLGQVPLAATTLDKGVPAPTGGKITPDEAKLAGNAQLPAPMIWATTNDVVEIRLKNLGVTFPGAPNDPHSIHLHGMDVDAANDGVPETSVAAVPANLKTPGAGNVVVYMFAPKYPGTYMYHCHQEADIHVQMGMYGALVVYNPDDPAATTGPGTGKGGKLWGWSYDKDYVLLLSEMDTGQHDSEEYGTGVFNPVAYKPQYWFINGLSFPNTIHVETGKWFNWANWIASHPNYDPFIVGSISKDHAGTSTTKGDKVLLRMINLGFETQPMHMHGFHGKIIGSDQRAWPWANDPTKDPFGQGMEKNTLTIGSGETYEWLLDFGQQSMANSTYSTESQTRYDPTSMAPVGNDKSSNPVIPLPGSTVTYVGGPTVTGAAGIQTPGQLFPFHNHDDYKATNNGEYPGGMFTMIMTVP